MTLPALALTAALASLRSSLDRPTFQYIGTIGLSFNRIRSLKLLTLTSSILEWPVLTVRSFQGESWPSCARFPSAGCRVQRSTQRLLAGRIRCELRHVLALPATEAQRVCAGARLLFQKRRVAIGVSSSKNLFAVSDQHISIALFCVIRHTIDPIVLYFGFLSHLGCHLDLACFLGD